MVFREADELNFHAPNNNTGICAETAASNEIQSEQQQLKKYYRSDNVKLEDI